MDNTVTCAWIEDLTWPEVEARLPGDAVVVLPVGAIAKEHGPHLPMKTDWLLARELAGRVGAALPVLIAPVIAFGYYPAFRHWPGSQHLGPETFTALVHDIITGLIAQGARHIAIVNTGVSTEPVLQVVTRELYESTGLRIPVANISRMGSTAAHLMEHDIDGHADEEETSMMLVIAPELVRLDRARRDDGNMRDAPATVFRQPSAFRNDPDGGIDHSATGARGDPSLATPEKGEAALAAMAAELIEGLVALFPDQLDVP
ncbi:MAG: creatininase family protein [Alphaproteobacteria bacterium]|jgi:creatinine amidohydrolase|nr:creatininase family protein [Rhodospirillaceae bacterium]MDG2482973.1 creatininase family protein [Alphaproteobacteria bacterium]MBT6203946.1 creatininase family protein [Rhodospirillaceae bacterium]MBT6510716.1 creatininase family protein [Rhodospirillaceae bacterium]MBT7611680.1 creatininase family protein [Rhodospirillaceae bacterium]